MASHTRHQTHVPAVRVEFEKSLGITQRSAPANFAWTGDIRKRYTDFLVYEIAKDGTVTHLYDYPEESSSSTNSTNTQHQATQNSAPNASQSASAASAQAPPVAEVETVSDADREILTNLLGEDSTTQIIELDQNIQVKAWNLIRGKSVQFPIMDDRDARRTVHQEVRRVFSSRLDTSADATGVITATQSKRGNKRAGPRSGPRQQSFDVLGGEYLHLTLYKENKDTMDAINTIARLLKIKASNFAFAGTKDRRAATVQRISIAKQRAQNVIWLNTRLPGIKAGDFTHSKEPLCLGQHGGNEFVIVLKNCELLSSAESSLDQSLRKIRDAVDKGLASLKARGYINYYGLQRFGTHTIGTHHLGMKILSGDFEGVVDDILHVDDHLVEEVLNQNGPVNNQSSTTDEFERARALTNWKMTKNGESALAILPKRFSSETAIIRHLATPTHHRDFMGAILGITRGMRMMYIHAYQSYVWNHVASLRWSKYGTTVIVGDLVLVDSASRPNGSSHEESVNYYDEEEFYARARHLTEQDVSSGKFTISDVVLPTPGFDVIYPHNDIGEFYKEFMARPENGKLSPFEMRRKQREFSLSGNYRTLMGHFLDNPKYCVRTYSSDTEQMYPTDLDICIQNKAKKRAMAEKQRQTARMSKAKDVTAWNHFATNPDQWDKAMAAERRRKAENEAPSDGTVRLQETWVQTGVDGQDNKRVKLTRQTFERLETTGHGENLTSVVSPAGDMSVNATEAKPGLGTENITSLTEAVYGSNGGDDTTAGLGDAKGLASLLRSSESKDGIPTSSNIQALAPPTGPAPDIIADSGASEKDTAKDEKDPHGWFGSNIPEVSSVSEDVKGPTSDENQIHGVAIPAFRTASENSILALAQSDPSNEGIDTTRGGEKIAVILKFQLKSSNYATVVLRELMGVPPNSSN